jgi:hypothetical protein
MDRIESFKSGLLFIRKTLPDESGSVLFAPLKAVHIAALVIPVNSLLRRA